MIEWKRVPWPLWVYSAGTLLGTSLIEANTHGPIPAMVLYPFVMLAWLYGLLKGKRLIWIVTVGISVLGFVPDVILGGLKWQGVILGLIGLALLLLPVTRQYFSSHTVVEGRA